MIHLPIELNSCLCCRGNVHNVAKQLLAILTTTKKIGIVTVATRKSGNFCGQKFITGCVDKILCNI